MRTSIKPDYFKDFREAQVLKEPTTFVEAENEEQLIADIYDLGGWNYLKKYILDLNEILDSLVDKSMESGASYEEIGQRTLIAKTAKSFLLRVIERVEEAHNARISSQTS